MDQSTLGSLLSTDLYDMTTEAPREVMKQALEEMATQPEVLKKALEELAAQPDPLPTTVDDTAAAAEPPKKKKRTRSASNSGDTRHPPGWAMLDAELNKYVRIYDAVNKKCEDRVEGGKPMASVCSMHLGSLRKFAEKTVESFKAEFGHFLDLGTATAAPQQ